MKGKAEKEKEQDKKEANVMIERPEIVSDERLYGLLAEFEDEHKLVEATKRTRERGFVHFDAYSPFPVEGLHEATGMGHTRLPTVVFIGGAIGGLTGFALQYWTQAVDYPLLIGGRPLAAWPAYIVVAFELTILFASIASFLGLLGLSGLPQPYHPLFNVERFHLASRDRFFLAIEARDERFHRESTRAFLEEVGSAAVYEVEK